MLRRFAVPSLAVALVLGTAVLPATGQEDTGETSAEIVCPDGAPDAGFSDVAATSVHKSNIDCAVDIDVVRGVTATTFDPGLSLTRAQAATLIARALDAVGVELPPASEGRSFPDVPSVHRDNVARLNAAGIALGRVDGTFGSSEPVRRDQLASLYVRALEYVLDEDLEAEERGYFPDVRSGVHAENVDIAFEFLIVNGRVDGTFGPLLPTRRDQAASVVINFLATLLELEPIEVQVLAINDFHGNLEPGTLNTGGTPSGGAEYLATHIRNLRDANPDTIVVSAGDLIGASPLLSALFHDEPTIEAMNEIGLDLNAVGNHEFDEGYEELLRMQEGGCHPVDGCLTPRDFAGAEFEFLAANVRYEGTDETIFPPYSIWSFSGGVEIAFIGMTLEGTPNIVTPAGVAGLEFDDEADTVNGLIGELEDQGVDNIVVLVHEGGTAGGGINGCTNVSGAIVDIVNRLDAEVDAVISGHTHAAYNCVINDIPVTSASSFGRVLTKMDLTVDPLTKRIEQVAADNRIVTRDVTQAADITAILDWYRPFYADLANRVIGTIEGATVISRSQNDAGESSLGNLIADSQLAATSPAGFGEARVAFMNPGGIRADLVGNEAGEVTYEAAFTVQPFGNSLVTMSLTGAQIDLLLEQQFCGLNSTATGGFNKILQVSDTFRYSWDASAINAATCDGADAVPFDSITLDGVPLVADQSYRITVNNFLASGGDGFSVLTQGTDLLGGALDLDALEAYLQAADGVEPPPLGRITRIG